MIGRFLKPQIAATKKSVLLLGPRQVGKSTLTKALNPNLIIQLANESLFQSHAKDPGLIARQIAALANGKNLIVVDEIQRLPSMLNTIQALIDDNKDLKFLITGSSARKLRRGEANLLPGRVLPFYMFPINFWEMAAAKMQIPLKTLLITGSLPEILTDKEEGVSILEAYSSIYLREEIQADGAAKDIGAYGRFLDVAAETSGQYINYSKLASDTEIGKETIRRFFQILEDTLLVHRIAPFQLPKSARKVRQSDRFIFFDLGVRNALLGKTRSNFTATELGPLFEQWLTLQLISFVHYQKKNWKLFSYRDDRQLEVDLILETEKEILAIEIKYQLKFRSDFAKNLEDFQTLYKETKPIRLIVVYIGDTKQKTSAGVNVLPYEYFLGQVVQNL